MALKKFENRPIRGEIIKSSRFGAFALYTRVLYIHLRQVPVLHRPVLTLNNMVRNRGISERSVR